MLFKFTALKCRGFRCFKTIKTLILVLNPGELKRYTIFMLSDWPTKIDQLFSNASLVKCTNSCCNIPVFFHRLRYTNRTTGMSVD